MRYSKDTSDKILDAAIQEFEEKGFSGARMQAIADKAGINKALLHYYYKSKDTLFSIIIKRALKFFIPKLIAIFEDDNDILTNIEEFTYSYINTFINNPRIPGFIIQELNKNPDRLIEAFHSTGLNASVIKSKIHKATEAGIIEPIEPEQLIINIISLCLFPFVAKPVLTGLLLEGNKQKFDKILEERKTEVAKFIIKAIRK